MLLGNERIGAPSALLNEGDLLVEIPQIGKIRSLNVHVSMVICLWEFLIRWLIFDMNKHHYDSSNSIYFIIIVISVLLKEKKMKREITSKTTYIHESILLILD